MSVSFADLEAILERIPPHPEHLVSALQEVQAKLNYIPAEALEAVCDHVGVPRSRGGRWPPFTGFSVSKPRKEHEINVCLGTACHVRGSAKVYEKLRRDLDPSAEKSAGPDAGYSLKKVYCLGCCSTGPVATVNGEIHGNLDQKKAEALIKTSSKR